jgi:hypothetical protein
MSQFFETPTRPFKAAGAIGQYLRVKTPSALVVAGASDVSIGVTENPVFAAGDLVAVRLANAQGTRFMVAAGEIAADDVVYAAAGGKVAATGTVIEGRALTAASGNNSVIEVQPLGANTLDAGTVTESGTQTLTNKTLTAPTMTAPVLGVATGTSLAVTAGLTSSGPTGAGIGYATGAGGAVSQDTDRTTGVTINKLSGAITTQATSLAAQTSVAFTVTNSTVAIGDVIVLSVRSGPTGLKTIATVTTVAAGSFQINLFNTDASTADTAAAVINFAVIKAVAA